jgi:hypothetical protein
MTVLTKYFPLKGGLNEVAPPLATNPGELIDCLNYECLPEGGYQRIKGYSRFDGQATASMAVPGTGDVLGVHVYKGDVYAIREDGTNGRLYKATASGWVEVDNTFTWSLGGTYRFTNYNFYGQDSQEEMFIVNGVDQAVKFDGATLTQLTTGTGGDNPSAVAGHKFHLFLCIESSLVNSATGNPTDFSAASGAAEIAVGDTIRDLKVANGALIVSCVYGAQVLYGNDSSDWQLEKLNETGTYAGTLANIGGQVIGLDNQGVMSLAASQTYGNFAYSSVSQKARNHIDFLVRNGTPVSTINRVKGQYRLFAGRNGAYITFSGTKLIGITKVRFEDAVTCITSAIDGNGDEVTYFGSTDGNVYQLDTTHTFDDAQIYDFLLLAFHHFGTPTQRKRFRLIQADMRGSGTPSELYARVITDYANGLRSSAQSINQRSTGGGLWDFSLWDQFTYDSLYHNDAKVRLSAVGTNMAVLISSDNANDGQHTIYGITVHYSPRRVNR